jgi:hypothetical protein
MSLRNTHLLALTNCILTLSSTVCMYVHCVYTRCRALSILLENIDCARRAIEFVGAHDKELWYQLIDYSLRNERFLGGLLDHAGVSHLS